MKHTNFEHRGQQERLSLAEQLATACGEDRSDGEEVSLSFLAGAPQPTHRPETD
jgi:hypothetical protein